MSTRIPVRLVVAIAAAVMAFHSDNVFPITVTLAEVRDGVAVVAGRKAASNADITWETTPVTTSSRNGKFSFESEIIPESCSGTLADGVSEVQVSLDNCPAEPPPPPPPALELTLAFVQEDAHLGTAIRAVDFVADGIVSGGEDAYLRRWSLDYSVSEAQAIDHTVYDLESAVDGSIVASGEGGWNGGTDTDTLRIWGADGLTGTRAPIGYVYCVALSANKEWLVASGFYGDILVYGVENLDLMATKSTKKKRTKALSFSPDGTLLASTSTAGRIRLWSFPSQDCSAGTCELKSIPVSLSHSGSWAFPMKFSPVSDEGMDRIASGSDGGMIKVWQLIHQAGGPPDVAVLAVDSGAVYALDWSPDGAMIVTGGNDQLTVYDAESLEILFRNEAAHNGRINDVAFSPDGYHIVSGGADGDLKTWSLMD